LYDNFSLNYPSEAGPYRDGASKVPVEYPAPGLEDFCDLDDYFASSNKPAELALAAEPFREDYAKGDAGAAEYQAKQREWTAYATGARAVHKLSMTAWQKAVMRADQGKIAFGHASSAHAKKREAQKEANLKMYTVTWNALSSQSQAQVFKELEYQAIYDASDALALYKLIIRVHSTTGRNNEHLDSIEAMRALLTMSMKPHQDVSQYFREFSDAVIRLNQCSCPYEVGAATVAAGGGGGGGGASGPLTPKGHLKIKFKATLFLHGLDPRRFTRCHLPSSIKTICLLWR
jgi:hypothetical protein